MSICWQHSLNFFAHVFCLSTSPLYKRSFLAEMCVWVKQLIIFARKWRTRISISNFGSDKSFADDELWSCFTWRMAKSANKKTTKRAPYASEQDCTLLHILQPSVMKYNDNVQCVAWSTIAPAADADWRVCVRSVPSRTSWIPVEYPHAFKRVDHQRATRMSGARVRLFFDACSRSNGREL